MSASGFLNGSIANEHLPQTTPPSWEMAASKKKCSKKMTSQPTKHVSQPTKKCGSQKKKKK